MAPLSDTHWPSRPELPFRFQHQGPGSILIVGLEEEVQDWALCITSLHLTSQSESTYFGLTLEVGSAVRDVGHFVVQGSSTLPLTFPTPLVIAESEPWRLVGTNYLTVSLFHSLTVGYWAPVGDRALREAEPRPVLGPSSPPGPHA